MSFRLKHLSTNKEVNLSSTQNTNTIINSVKKDSHAPTVLLSKKSKLQYLLYDAAIYNINDIKLKSDISRNFNTINDETKITTLNKENSISSNQKSSRNFLHDKKIRSVKKSPRPGSMKYTRNEENDLFFDKINDNELKNNSIRRNNINNYYIFTEDNILSNKKKLFERGFTNKLNIDINNLLSSHKKDKNQKLSKPNTSRNQQNKRNIFNLCNKIKYGQYINKYNEDKIEFSKLGREFNKNNVPFNKTLSYTTKKEKNQVKKKKPYNNFLTELNKITRNVEFLNKNNEILSKNLNALNLLKKEEDLFNDKFKGFLDENLEIKKFSKIISNSEDKNINSEIYLLPIFNVKSLLLKKKGNNIINKFNNKINYINIIDCLKMENNLNKNNINLNNNKSITLYNKRREISAENKKNNGIDNKCNIVNIKFPGSTKNNTNSNNNINNKKEFFISGLKENNLFENELIDKQINIKNENNNILSLNLNKLSSDIKNLNQENLIKNNEFKNKNNEKKIKNRIIKLDKNINKDHLNNNKNKDYKKDFSMNIKSAYKISIEIKDKNKNKKSSLKKLKKSNNFTKNIGITDKNSRKNLKFQSKNKQNNENNTGLFSSYSTKKLGKNAIFGLKIRTPNSELITRINNNDDINLTKTDKIKIKENFESQNKNSNNNTQEKNEEKEPNSRKESSKNVKLFKNCFTLDKDNIITGFKGESMKLKKKKLRNRRRKFFYKSRRKQKSKTFTGKSDYVLFLKNKQKRLELYTQEKMKVMQNEIDISNKIRDLIKKFEKNDNGKEFNKKLQKLLDRLEAYRKLPEDKYIKYVKENYEFICQEVEKIERDRNMEYRINAFIDRLDLERDILDSQREFVTELFNSH